MEKFIFKYGISGVDVPADLKLIFLKEYPWIECFAVIKNKVIVPDSEDVGSRYDTLFNGVIIGLGEISLKGTRQDGSPILSVPYEIVGVPPELEDLFQDIVAGKGPTFEALKSLVDALVSAFTSEVYNEVLAEQTEKPLTSTKTDVE